VSIFGLYTFSKQGSPGKRAIESGYRIRERVEKTILRKIFKYEKIKPCFELSELDTPLWFLSMCYCFERWYLIRRFARQE